MGEGGHCDIPYIRFIKVIAEDDIMIFLGQFRNVMARYLDIPCVMLRKVIGRVMIRIFLSTIYICIYYIVQFVAYQQTNKRIWRVGLVYFIRIFVFIVHMYRGTPLTMLCCKEYGVKSLKIQEKNRHRYVGNSEHLYTV